MIYYLRGLIIAVCCIGFFRCLSQTGDLYPVSLEERCQKAVLIIEGKVVNQYSFWDMSHRKIYTSNLVTVYKIFKGSTGTDQVEIITEGGRVGMQRQELSSTLSLTAGQSGIFFCIAHQVRGQLRNIANVAGSYMVYSSQQGFIEYNVNDRTAIEPFAKYASVDKAASAIKAMTSTEKTLSVNPDFIAVTSGVKNQRTLAAVISGFSPTIIPAGTGEILTINGSGFGAIQGTGAVEFKTSENGGATYMRPFPIDYVFWSDAQIRLKVPSAGNSSGDCAGTGIFRVITDVHDTVASSSVLTIPYGYVNYTAVENNMTVLTGMPNLVNDNGKGGYTFSTQERFAANTPAVNAFNRALNTWSCSTKVNWEIGNTTPVDSEGEDGINIVRFDKGDEMPVGILGRCISSSQQCGSGIQAVWSITEFDMVFNDEPAVPWQFGPESPSFDEYDFESVALHELGHAHQLRHTINMGSVMYFTIANGRTLRTLGAGDTTGGNFVMRHSAVSNSCGSIPIANQKCQVALPMELISFGGRYESNSGVLLAWKTTQESGISGYRVQRSKDGINFVNIDFVKSKMAVDLNQYEYIDKEIFTGKCYYRLGILDLDGKEKFSDVIAFNLGSRSGSFAVYPNPAKDVLAISGSNIDLSRARFELFTMDGRKVQSHQYFENTNSFNKKISIRELAAGIYFYVLQTGTGETFRGRVIKGN